MIAVVCGWNGNVLPLAEFAVPRFQSYCDRYGYRLFAERHDLILPGERHPYWTKWHVLRRHWDEAAAFLLLDLDVIVTNPELKIERLLYREWTVGRDNQGINAGVQAILKTSWSTAFLERLWSLGERCFKGWSAEDQTCLAHNLLLEDPCRWRVAPQREMNSYDYRAREICFPEGQWQPGDWLLHAAGGKIQEKLRILSAPR